MPVEIGQEPGNGAPWGNIYNTGMPNTEAAQAQETGMRGKMLLMQQREQQAQKQAKLKEAQDQQDAINAKVRGADAPIVMQKYNDVRAASMDLDKNSKNLSREELLNRQQQVNQKWGDLNKLINDSVQGKALDAEDIKNQSDQSKSLMYNDDAHNILNRRISLPISEWKKAPVLDSKGKPVLDENGSPKTQDLSDPSLQRYTPKEDFTPLIENAVGKSGKLNGGIAVGNTNGINRTTKDYTGTNSAYNIANTLSTGLQADDKKGGLKAVERQADLLHQYGNVSTDDMAAIDKQYNEQYANNPSVKEAYGLTGKENFPQTGNPKIDGIVKYIAQKQAMLPNNMPKAEIKNTTNEAAKTAEDHNFDIYKMNYADKLKKGDESGAGKTIDEGFNSMISGNGNVSNSKITKPDGTVSTENRTEISAPLAFRNVFTAHQGAKKPIVPDAVVKRNNGNLVGVYYQRDDSGNIVKDKDGTLVTRQDIIPVEMDQNTAKIAYAKVAGGLKGVEALSKYNNAPKAFNKSDLLSKGWSESQINQAVKAGKIKVQ